MLSKICIIHSTKVQTKVYHALSHRCMKYSPMSQSTTCWTVGEKLHCQDHAYVLGNQRPKRERPENFVEGNHSRSRWPATEHPDT